MMETSIISAPARPMPGPRSRPGSGPTRGPGSGCTPAPPPTPTTGLSGETAQPKTEGEQAAVEPTRPGGIPLAIEQRVAIVDRQEAGVAERPRGDTAHVPETRARRIKNLPPLPEPIAQIDILKPGGSES